MGEERGGRLAGRVLGAVRRLAGHEAPLRAYPLGLVLGFLPCGLSYSAFAAAAATGHPARGMALALVFGPGRCRRCSSPGRW